MDSEEDKLLLSLMKVFIAQMDSALKISKIISEHGGEEEMSPDSLVTGLIYRLMVSMNDEEMKESLDFAEDCLHKESSSDEEEEQEGEQEDNYETINEIQSSNENITPRTIKRNTCNCDICVSARVCLANYSTHEIEDELAGKFKDAIDNSCNIHKLNI